MSRLVKVALVVTVEVDPAAWELAQDDYSDEDVIDYIRDQIQRSTAVQDGRMSPNVYARFRRPPQEGKS